MINQNTPPIIDYEGSDYQASFWDQGERAYEDRVEAIALRRLLPPEGGQRLLELGAGAGRNTPRYQNYNQIVLLDYSISQLQQAMQRLDYAKRYCYVAADLYHLPFAPNNFDAATMIRALHHMADAPLALAQVEKVLCGQAVFILEYANKRNLKAIGRYLLGRQKWNPFSPAAVEFAKLNFDFHPRTIQKWLKQCRFNIERTLSVSHFRADFLKKLLPLNLLVWMDSVLQPSGALVQLTPSVFLRARDTKPPSPVLEKLTFRCPSCDFFPLEDRPPKLICPKCRHQYAVRDGIYDFRIKD